MFHHFQKYCLRLVLKRHCELPWACLLEPGSFRLRFSDQSPFCMYHAPATQNSNQTLSGWRLPQMQEVGNFDPSIRSLSYLLPTTRGRPVCRLMVCASIQGSLALDGGFIDNLGFCTQQLKNHHGSRWPEQESSHLREPQAVYCLPIHLFDRKPVHQTVCKLKTFDIMQAYLQQKISMPWWPRGTSRWSSSDATMNSQSFSCFKKDNTCSTAAASLMHALWCHWRPGCMAR